MKFKRNQNLKIGGEQPKNSLTEKKKRQRYKFAAAILAIFVLHFVWQFSFIQRENLRIAENSLDSARLDVLPVESQPNEKFIEITPELTAKKTEVEKTAKDVLPVKYSPSENNRLPPEVKQKTVREPRAERLRRAEKLLTGF